MEKLATKSEGKMKAVVDKTVENLSNLKQDESKLLNEVCLKIDSFKKLKRI